MKFLKIVTLDWNSRQNGKTVSFPWKLYKTLFSGHAKHVLAKSHFWASKVAKSWNCPQILFKTEKQEAFHENSTKGSFQVMRSTVWPNRIFSASKFTKSWNWPEILFKTEKQCAFHKNCTKPAFQVMRSTFWQNRIFERQRSQNRETGLKFSSKLENSAVFIKIVQNALFRLCAARFGQIAFFQRQSPQNRHTGLKFSPKRENSALSTKIVQNALFRWCAARFGQIAFVSVKVLKIVTVAWNSRQNGKTVRFPSKLYKTLISGHAQHVLAKSHFWAPKFSKSWNRPKILFKTRKQCAFHENCTKPAFQVMRSTFLPNRIFERQSFQIRHTGLKFSRKRENSALSMKMVQNAYFRSCAGRLGEIAFLSGKVLKIVTVAWNSLQNGKTERFPWKLYKTLFSGHAQHVLAKLHFWASKFSKSSHWPEILAKTLKQWAFHENSTSAPFRSCAARFGQIAFLSVKVFKDVTLALRSVQNGRKVGLPWKLYKTLFSGHAQHVLAKSDLWALKFSKSWNLPEMLFKPEKQCASHENCTKRSLQKGKTVRLS